MSVDIKAVEKIAQTIMSAQDQNEQGRGDYLKALVRETQTAVGAKGAERQTQMAALKTVHDVFYEAVLRIAETFVPRGTKDRGTLIHARANFARTSASLLRRFISMGHDVMGLKPATVTKTYLRSKVPIGPKRRTARALRGLTERRSKQMVATILELAEADREAATEEIKTLIGQLQLQLEELAKAEKRQSGRIRPSDTQVVAARSMPA